MADTFDIVPYVVSRRPTAISRLWAAAATRPVRIACFDDSQGSQASAAPIGLNYEFWRHFRNTPETPLSLLGNTGSEAGTTADWCIRSQAQSTAATRVASARQLPGLAPLAIGDYSHTAMLDPTGLRHLSSLWMRYGTFFKAGALVDCDVFSHTYATGGDSLVYYNMPTAGPELAVGGATCTQVSTGTLVTGLASATPEWKKNTITGLSLAARAFYQCILSGGANKVDVAGMRFKSTVDQTGVVCQQMGVGGYKTESVLANHANAGDLFNLLGMDMVLIGYGYNDAFAGSGLSVATYKANTIALVDLIRTWNADIPIVFATEGYPATRGTTNHAAKYANFVQYAGALAEICNAYDANCHLINSGRLTYEMGWNPTVEEFTGLTDKSDWDVGVAYVAGDYVRFSIANGVYQYYRCHTNHTSTNLLNPLRKDYWMPWAIHLSDGTHYTPVGVWKMQAARAHLLLTGFGETSGTYSGTTDSQEAVRTVTITPLQTTLASNRYTLSSGENFSLPVAQHETISWTWTVVDSKAEAVDLSGELVRLVIHERDGDVLFVLDTVAGGVVVGGDSGNQVTVTLGPTQTANRGLYEAKLWRAVNDSTETGSLLASGTISVKLAPIKA